MYRQPTEFDFNFSIFDISQLVVTRITIADGTELVLNESTEYTVAGEDDGAGGYDFSNGGTITTLATYPSAYQLRIERITGIDQDFASFGSISADTLESCFDKITMIMQELNQRLEELEE